ncbi:M48 family metalloprotease [Sphingomonas sp. ID1715]|uniref:M48 family metallopeptidase n=1 Tax=Sphingomonas sp. ID1715 TaxID=1656898 RepID=UPI001489DE25|nr:M48 family metallopeptidase [Sphingomonas sp. ID1715]NNM76575.1 M48 family metalloprotease [Sphingomonas sp. ID1715]
MRRAALAAVAAAFLASAAVAADLVPTGSPAAAGYQPLGPDEQGVWTALEEAERDLKASKLLVRDEALAAYLRQVLCRTAPAEGCKAIRIYVVRDPQFNASMTANGMLLVNSGLLLRIRSEAELAAILGHEYAHFERRHSLALLKKARSATGFAAFLGAAGGLPLQLALIGSVFSFSQDQEREADIDGLKAMRAAGYRTRSAGEIWANLRAEMDATAVARQVRSRKDRRGMFETHPTTAERLTYLTASAASDPEGKAAATEYRTAISPLWPMLIDDQVKLNDFGGSDYLLNGLASGGWTGSLLYARGELYRFRGQADDFDKAAGYYREALAMPDAPPAAWRGLGLALARSGDGAGARTAIDEYLKRNPQASDKAMLAMISGGTQ